MERMHTTESCEYCDTYHRLGYQRCPACQPVEYPPHAEPTPALLLEDLLDQLTRYHHDHRTADPVTIAGWLALAKRLKRVVAVPGA
jgi:hypothetical protein